jgi:hypothetical protein
MRALILILAVAVGGATLSRADQPRETPAVVTSNKRDKEVQKQFESLAVAITLEEKAVVLSLGKMAGFCRYGGFIPRYRPIQDSSITLSEVGESFSFSIPHVTTTYTLYRVGVDSVTFFYQQETDFSSWGKDLITIDRGTFTVPVKPKK